MDEDSREVLVPQTVGPLGELDETRKCECIEIDTSGAVRASVKDPNKACDYTLYDPRNKEADRLENLYEVEIQLIERGLLCHEMSEGDEEIRSPWSWKWKEETYAHQKVYVQRFCDIDGDVWVLTRNNKSNIKNK